jgi:hypothetical protein
MVAQLSAWTAVNDHKVNSLYTHGTELKEIPSNKNIGMQQSIFRVFSQWEHTFLMSNMNHLRFFEVGHCTSLKVLVDRSYFHSKSKWLLLTPKGPLVPTGDKPVLDSVAWSYTIFRFFETFFPNVS